jgi:hypothetical protein
MLPLPECKDLQEMTASVKTSVRAVLERARIRDLLTSTAVVLDRIARGGGACNWYYCRGAAELDTLEERLSPGGVVTFYFDDAIRRSFKSPQLNAEIEKIIAEMGDAMVGVLGEDGVEVTASIVVSGEDLAEFMSEVPSTALVFYGTFPGREDDGRRAVTVTLPDRDGVIRSHPH